jgi:methylenetetrahydrofolate dehydrogenase (NADP+)/methenyltetrahydrofolate cyclohydrolase
LPARILDGKALADSLRQELARDVQAFRDKAGRPPALVVVLVGDNPASQVYVKAKETASRKVGISGEILRLPADTPHDRLLATIDRLNDNPFVDGILVQLPLPPQIQERAILERIDPAKDVDGFHPQNVGLLAIGRPRFAPCTPLGIQTLLVRNGIETAGKRALVLGRSNIVGKPMALLLLQKGQGGDATVTVAHTASKNLPELCRQAEILIVAAGQPELVRRDWIQPGAVVVDVGIHRRPDGSLVGDVAYAEAAEIADWITPVPGGVGPMTIAMLLQNTLHAAQLRNAAPPAKP